MLLRLLAAWPRAVRWVDRTVETHADRGTSAAALEMDGLRDVVPSALMRRAVIVVTDSVPRPPLEIWGLGRVDAFAGTPPRAIALRDTIFLTPQDAGSESLLLHELVHVIQWQRLGSSRFILLYGWLLAEHGYDGNPLETMAHTVQGRLESGEALPDLVPSVVRSVDEEIRRFRARSLLHRLLMPGLRDGPRD
jgi:hypothetical protein